MRSTRVASPDGSPSGSAPTLLASTCSTQRRINARCSSIVSAKTSFTNATSVRRLPPLELPASHSSRSSFMAPAVA